MPHSLQFVFYISGHDLAMIYFDVNQLAGLRGREEQVNEKVIVRSYAGSTSTLSAVAYQPSYQPMLRMVTFGYISFCSHQHASREYAFKRGPKFDYPLTYQLHRATGTHQHASADTGEFRLTHEGELQQLRLRHWVLTGIGTTEVKVKKATAQHLPVQRQFSCRRNLVLAHPVW